MKKYLNRRIFYTFLHLQMDADPDQTYHFDPDPAYHFDADADSDPDPAFQFDADAPGSTTLVLEGNFIFFCTVPRNLQVILSRTYRTAIIGNGIGTGNTVI
jgi:hypothetical protein